ncbi:MAG: Gfo/Idh/MocA family oxidoreductase [Phycisphaerales bacterium]
MTQRLRMGMVGGGRDAFIGAVHRRAAALDGQIELVAGALSRDPQRAVASGRELGLAESRAYPSWQAMLEGEAKLPPAERIDFVSIVTPNDTHFEIAVAFTAAGLHVVCDKPLCHSSEQARALIQAVEKAGTVFAVTYNYSGYPMVRQARAMVREGQLGPIRKVIVEYHQSWLASALEQTGQKQAAWRTDPARSGLGGAIGDIGSHAEHLSSYITGLELEAICADLTAFVPGRRLDDDANLLLRFKGGARGVMIASQVEIGHENDLRIRVCGEKGSLDWRQEEPNELWHRQPASPDQVLRRGNPYLADEARAATRLPPGHPEAFIEAFANIYLDASAEMRRRRGRAAAVRPKSGAPASQAEYPTVYDGARGVAFIEKAVESARSDRKWTDAAWSA